MTASGLPPAHMLHHKSVAPVFVNLADLKGIHVGLKYIFYKMAEINYCTFKYLHV